jgi:SnoaL-like domain
MASPHRDYLAGNARALPRRESTAPDSARRIVTVTAATAARRWEILMTDTAVATEIVERYLACWNAAADDRPALLESTFAAQARYVDPIAEAGSRDELGAVIATVREQFPDFVFTAGSTPDSHHHVTRFTWGLGPAGAEPIIIGFDVISTDQDGRIDSVLGFLDRVPN